MQVTLSVLICIAFGLRMSRCILPPESCEEAISHIDRSSSTWRKLKARVLGGWLRWYDREMHGAYIASIWSRYIEMFHKCKQCIASRSVASRSERQAFLRGHCSVTCAHSTWMWLETVWVIYHVESKAARPSYVQKTRRSENTLKIWKYARSQNSALTSIASRTSNNSMWYKTASSIMSAIRFFAVASCGNGCTHWEAYHAWEGFGSK